MANYPRSFAGLMLAPFNHHRFEEREQMSEASRLLSEYSF
jgi:hypothetical protein